jgi:hypothetical protein
MKHMNDNERRIAKTNVVEETVFLSMEAQASREIKECVTYHQDKMSTKNVNLVAIKMAM